MVKVCSYCGGTKKMDCPKCEGTGRVYPSEEERYLKMNARKCPVCKGNMVVPCKHCKPKRRAL